MKQFTIEDVKRLVPEAVYEPVRFFGDAWSFCGKLVSPSTSESFRLLLTTRAQLEVAVGALKHFKHQEGNTWGVANEALAKLKELQDE